MTDEDLVIRRRTRAPQRLVHVLEAATEEELQDYERRNQERAKAGVDVDFYMNKKGGVSAVEGDANLDQIADVSYLLDTFFSGAPAPKGLFGYTAGLARDILEDLKRDFFDELDALQDTVAYAYQLGFELDLLLRGVNPMQYEMQVAFAERRTETPNQAADRALKIQAMGASQRTTLETAGLEYETERKRLEDEAQDIDPYPQPGNIGAQPGMPRVSITPGNQRKSESGTAISNP
jgi:hypothetical protein